MRANTAPLCARSPEAPDEQGCSVLPNLKAMCDTALRESSCRSATWCLRCLPPAPGTPGWRTPGWTSRACSQRARRVLAPVPSSPPPRWPLRPAPRLSGRRGVPSSHPLSHRCSRSRRHAAMPSSQPLASHQPPATSHLPLATPSQAFWSGMSDVGLGTRREGDLARLQELFSRSGSASVPLRDEGRRREPSTAREVCSTS